MSSCQSFNKRNLFFFSAPGQPQMFQVTVISSTSVRMGWALPSETNGIIRGFKVRYEKAGTTSSKNIPGTTTLSYVVTGLDKCTQYSFRILAYTVKDGPYTSVVQKTTAEDGRILYILETFFPSFRSIIPCHGNGQALEIKLLIYFL